MPCRMRDRLRLFRWLTRWLIARPRTRSCTSGRSGEARTGNSPALALGLRRSEVPQDAGSGRRELSEWVSRHPLAARVIVNRIWEWHFGRGLVRSSNDFGARGEAPTHPELLDFLAARFVQSGYSIKAMHRLILQTATYHERARHRTPAIPTTAGWPTSAVDA